MNNNVVFQEKYELRNKVKYHIHLHNRRGKTVAPHCRTKLQGTGVGSTSRGGDGGLGVEMGGFRDQGVETGRFRCM